MIRRIRVHIGSEPTFVIEAEHGIITKCTRTRGPDAVGRNEVDVAEEYRALRATFVDLVNDRTEVRVARGYRPRDTSVPFTGIRRRNADGEPIKRAPKKADKPPNPRNAIVESIRQNKPVVEGDFPF